jgi:hypothetical protein
LVAVVIQYQIAGIGCVRSRLGVLDPADLRITEVVPAPEGYVDGRPAWIEPDRRLLFERVTLATGRRRIMAVDLTERRAQEFRPQLPGDENGEREDDLWLMASRKGLVVVGRSAFGAHDRRPHELHVCTSDGRWLVRCALAYMGRAAAAISPDGTRVAYIATLGQQEPLSTSLTQSCLCLITLADKRDQCLWEPAWPQDQANDDPLTPYELAW